MDPPKKILVVGERQTGKTQIIKAFRDYNANRQQKQVTASSRNTQVGGKNNKLLLYKSTTCNNIIQEDHQISQQNKISKDKNKKLKLSQQFNSGIQEGDNWLHLSNSTKTGTNINHDTSSGVVDQINLAEAENPEKPLIDNGDDALSKKLFTPVVNQSFVTIYQNEDRKSLRSPLVVNDGKRKESLIATNNIEITKIPPARTSMKKHADKYDNQALPKQNLQSNSKHTDDFSLKILNIDGDKVRVQIWDQGMRSTPETTFQPLYIRHVSACIIVANTSNPTSITKAQKWKQHFDHVTKMKDEPSIPCTLFINHDDLKEQDEFQDDYQSFQEPIDIDDGYTEVDDLHASPVDYQKQQKYEKLAKQEKNCYFGVYHVSATHPLSVYKSFENLIKRVSEEEKYTKGFRTQTIASNFFDEYSVKRAFRSGSNSLLNCEMTREERCDWDLTNEHSFKLGKQFSKRSDRNSVNENNGCCK